MATIPQKSENWRNGRSWAKIAFWTKEILFVLTKTAVKPALIIFLTTRVFLSLWAIVALAVNPLPAEPDEVVRPYLGEPILDEGAAGLLLGPWQRFDSQHYLRIARQGYTDEADSVFPPLYPLVVRGLGNLFGGGPVANLAAAVILSNFAFLGLLLLLYRVAAMEMDAHSARRTLLYLSLFPTGFFLLAPYTESLFILLVLGALWSARNGRFGLAGFLGLLASLTRLTGWILVVPLAYEYWQQRKGRWDTAVVATLLPGIGTATFMAWRWQVGLPSLSATYEQYWFQTTGIPGRDLITAVNSLVLNGAARAGEFTLFFDLFTAFFLLGTTIWTFRKLGKTFGLYAALLLVFMLLPTSHDFKPLYSFSRYALAFFPTFMLLGMAGERPWINRLILYPSLILYLYFSSQYFVWGWVA